MRVLQRLRHSPIGFNMTPMIDVVFLLIIFFLVSSHLAQRETRIPVELPSALGGFPDLPTELPRLTLTLQRHGDLWLSGRRFSVDQIQSHLVDQRRRHGDRLELRIRCDRDLAYRDVEPVLGAAAEAGIWKVTFSVTESPDPSR